MTLLTPKIEGNTILPKVGNCQWQRRNLPEDLEYPAAPMLETVK